MKTKDSKPVFDREVGAPEELIIQKYGQPTRALVVRPRDLVGELRTGIKAKLSSQETPVKELSYQGKNGERIFWLTESATHVWSVISDATIPGGSAF